MNFILRIVYQELFVFQRLRNDSRCVGMNITAHSIEDNYVAGIFRYGLVNDFECLLSNLIVGTLCGSKEGLQIKNNVLKINKIEFDRQTETKVDTSAGGVAFYSGASSNAIDVEANNWIRSIIDDTDPVVLPKQALVVSEILEAIYESSKTGKPVYFQ